MFATTRRPSRPSLVGPTLSSPEWFSHAPPLRKRTSYLFYLRPRWAKFKEPHVCTMPESLKENPILNETIDSGILIKTRRRLKSFFMISRRHPYTSMMFRSMNEVRLQEVMHLLNFKHMIHPFSYFCLYYEFFMALCTLFYLAYILPTDLHYRRAHTTVKLMKFAFDMVMTLNMIMQFFTGYVDKENMCVVMKPSVVAKHNVKTYFFWDFLSCIPSYMIFIFTIRDRHQKWVLLKWLSLFRMVRLMSIDRALDIFIKYYKVPTEVQVILQIIMKSYMVILLLMALVTFLAVFGYTFDVGEEEDREMYTKLMFFTLKSVIGVGKLYISTTFVEATARIFITAVHLILHIWIIGKLYLLWQRFLVIADAGEDHYQQLEGYLNFKGLPSEIRDDVYRFYDFKFQTKFYDETAIYNMLTQNFKKEIKVYRLDRSIERIRFLRILPTSIITKIISSMEPVYFCPGDIIFRVDSDSDILYLIQLGTVALHDEYGTEICHLEDGSYYGDISVALNMTHAESMTAITCCKIFILKHITLMQILEEVPSLKAQVMEISRHLYMNRGCDWVLYHSKRNVTLMEKTGQGEKRPSLDRPSVSWV